MLGVQKQCDIRSHSERCVTFSMSLGSVGMVALRAWFLRCQRIRCQQKLAACRWRWTALTSSRRCLSEWARLAGTRPVAADDVQKPGAPRMFEALEGVPGCLPDQPLMEAPAVDLRFGKSMPENHPAAGVLYSPSVLPWDELTPLMPVLEERDCRQRSDTAGLVPSVADTLLRSSCSRRP